MDTYWDAFLRVISDESKDMTQRQLLERFYVWLEHQGMIKHV